MAECMKTAIPCHPLNSRPVQGGVQHALSDMIGITRCAVALTKHIICGATKSGDLVMAFQHSKQHLRHMLGMYCSRLGMRYDHPEVERLRDSNFPRLPI